MKVCLNFICKDEEHVIERMLNSTLKICDCIVANDTGSSDNTIKLIKEFGEKYDIPTLVVEREFDNFGNSRNYALESLKKYVSEELKWDLNDTFHIWLDCDEQFEYSEKFDKSKLKWDKDIYKLSAVLGVNKYSRVTAFRLSKNVEWYGPLHEYLRPKENMTSGDITEFWVNVKNDGNSWKIDTNKKYKKDALLYEKFILEDSDIAKDPRWLFYCAQSWHDSATSKNEEENKESLRRSMYYYKKRIESEEKGYFEEIYYSQLRIGIIQMILKEDFNVFKDSLLEAYKHDNMRGEGFKYIIQYYQREKKWHNSLIFTKFCYDEFHGKSPYPKRILFIEEALYEWKFLEMHIGSLFYNRRIKEAQKLCIELEEIMNGKIHLFTKEDVVRVKKNINHIKSIKI